MKVTREPEEATRWGNPQSEQKEKQAEVTLEPEESVGGSRKERNALSLQFGLRFDPAPVWLKGQIHTRQDLLICDVPGSTVTAILASKNPDRFRGSPSGRSSAAGRRENGWTPR